MLVSAKKRCTSSARLRAEISSSAARKRRAMSRTMPACAAMSASSFSSVLVKRFASECARSIAPAADPSCERTAITTALRTGGSSAGMIASSVSTYAGSVDASSIRIGTSLVSARSSSGASLGNDTPSDDWRTRPDPARTTSGWSGCSRSITRNAASDAPASLRAAPVVVFITWVASSSDASVSPTSRRICATASTRCSSSRESTAAVTSKARLMTPDTTPASSNTGESIARTSTVVPSGRLTVNSPSQLLPAKISRAISEISSGRTGCSASSRAFSPISSSGPRP